MVAFYLPPCPCFEEYYEKITKNGGIVVDQQECFSFQLRPDNAKAKFSDFYAGKIYSARWIVESIAAGKCLSSEGFFVCINIDDNARKLNIGKKKKYTIIEGIKLYEIITNQKSIQ